MQLSGFLFGVTDWSKIERTEHKGATGTSFWRTPDACAAFLKADREWTATLINSTRKPR